MMRPGCGRCSWRGVRPYPPGGFVTSVAWTGYWLAKHTTPYLASPRCRDPPLTTRTNNFAGCLDYIFVSPRHFDVLRTLELPYEHSSGEEAPRGDPGRGGAGGGKGEAAGTYPGVRDPMDVPFPPIPNEVFPSDHLSLAVVLGLR